MGLMVYNILPAYVKERSYNVKEFKCLLKNFFDFSAFYTLEEYFQYDNT
jgi:hypothetical protein